MDQIYYFKDLSKCIPDYTKIVLIMFLTRNDVDLPTECGYLRNDINRLCIEF